MEIVRHNSYNCNHVLDAIHNGCKENLYIRHYIKSVYGVELTQSNISSTLNILQSLDMVEYEKDKQRHLYRLTENWDKYENMIKMIDSYQIPEYL